MFNTQTDLADIVHYWHRSPRCGANVGLDLYNDFLGDCQSQSDSGFMLYR